MLFAAFLVLNAELGLTPSNFFDLANYCNPLKEASAKVPLFPVLELCLSDAVFVSGLLDAGPAPRDAQDHGCLPLGYPALDVFHLLLFH
jgi:hypothetical protein